MFFCWLGKRLQHARNGAKRREGLHSKPENERRATKKKIAIRQDWGRKPAGGRANSPEAATKQRTTGKAREACEGEGGGSGGSPTEWEPDGSG